MRKLFKATALIGWIVLLATVFWFTTRLANAQDLHNAITTVTYIPSLKAFTWVAVKHYDDTDATVLGSGREFDITYSKRLMGLRKESRQFSEKEQQNMLKNMALVTEFHAQIFKDPVVSINWDAVTGHITTTIVTDSGEKEYVLDKEYKVTPEVPLEVDQADTMYSFATQVMLYLLDSVEWWDAGEGRALDKAENKGQK